MSKTANINVRIIPEIKEKAETILGEIGISSSSAINLFYRQIILNNGLPFELKLPENKLTNISDLSKEELIELLTEGLKDVENESFSDVETCFSSISTKIWENLMF